MPAPWDWPIAGQTVSINASWTKKVIRFTEDENEVFALN
jgi:hypothetical protein